MADALERVGLTSYVASLPDGVDTQLRNGGEPLDRDRMTRLLLARACLGTPPLLVLDRIGSDIDDPHRVLGALLADRGQQVTVLADRGEQGGLAAWATQHWDLGSLEPTPIQAAAGSSADADPDTE